MRRHDINIYFNKYNFLPHDTINKQIYSLDATVSAHADIIA
jgi:hypothetical protein